MGLQLSHEIATGHTGNYWAIDELYIEPIKREAGVRLRLWKDQQARIDGKPPMTLRTYGWHDEDYPYDLATLDTVGKNPMNIAYDIIKTKPEFEGAVDV